MLPSEILAEKVLFLVVFFFFFSCLPSIGQTMNVSLDVKSLTWIEFAKGQPAEFSLGWLSQVAPASLAHRTLLPAAQTSQPKVFRASLLFESPGFLSVGVKAIAVSSYRLRWLWVFFPFLSICYLLASVDCVATLTGARVCW